MSDLRSAVKTGKKDPNYLLCYNCKKKFKAPAAKAEQEEREEQKYSNIRPGMCARNGRQRCARHMTRCFLSTTAGAGRRSPVPAQEDPEKEDYDDYYGEEKLSKAPVIILGIAIVVVAAVIVYMLIR